MAAVTNQFTSSDCLSTYFPTLRKITPFVEMRDSPLKTVAKCIAVLVVGIFVALYDLVALCFRGKPQSFQLIQKSVKKAIPSRLRPIAPRSPQGRSKVPAQLSRHSSSSSSESIPKAQERPFSPIRPPSSVRLDEEWRSLSRVSPDREQTILRSVHHRNPSQTSQSESVREEVSPPASEDLDSIASPEHAREASGFNVPSLALPAPRVVSSSSEQNLPRLGLSHSKSVAILPTLEIHRDVQETLGALSPTEAFSSSLRDKEEEMPLSHRSVEAEARSSVSRRTPSDVDTRSLQESSSSDLPEIVMEDVLSQQREKEFMRSRCNGTCSPPLPLPLQLLSPVDTRSFMGSDHRTLPMDQRPKHSPVLSLRPPTLERALSSARSSRSAARSLRVESSADEVLLERIDWKAFETYFFRFCVPPSCANPHGAYQSACGLALYGLNILQLLWTNTMRDEENKAEKLRALCWGLALYAVNKGQGFDEGTFEMPDPGHRVFHYFLRIFYPRASTHYKHRAIPVEEASGWKHFGYDWHIDGDLPAHKRTVMFGKIETHDGTDRIYIKMENWGADLALNFPNMVHITGHTLEFFHSQVKRRFPFLFGDVGGGPHMRKEHMRGEDIMRCTGFAAELAKYDIVPESEQNLQEYGLSHWIEFLSGAMLSPKLTADDLRDEIRSYLESLRKRYDNLYRRKGNEVQVITKKVESMDLRTLPPAHRMVSLDDSSGSWQLVV